MKIGLYGGTFNPFHNGHIGITRHVQTVYDLDKIFFIPSAIPPHKPGKTLAPAKDRFKMVEQSLISHPDLLVSDVELNRDGPSYTIDTIDRFKKEFSRDTRFYLLMGSDAFLDITTWKATHQLFHSIHIIVMLRGDWKNIDLITSFIDENISKRYSFDRTGLTFSHETKQGISICKVPKIDISSTMVRQRVKQNLPIHDLVPAQVEQIIRTKELYR